jgi:hypothetical protein
MPTPFIRRYQKHVTIKLSKKDKITIIRPHKGVTIHTHPLDESNKKNPEYANISLTSSDIFGMYQNRNDMNEKIDQCLSSLNIVNDKVEDNISRTMTDPNKNKRGPCNLFYFESPELDGQYDHLRSKLIKVRRQMVSKEEVKRVNDIFINKMGFPHGLPENQDSQIMGELYSTNSV